jgi:hypothetical protein
LKNGKTDAWKTFGRFLPLLYPSGKLPTTPPAKTECDISVATKLARIEKLGNEMLVPRLQGDEPWTRNDDVWWDVVEVNVEASEEMPLLNTVENIPSDELDLNHPKDFKDLCRRGSTPSHSFLDMYKCASWLEQLSPSFIPLTPSSLPSSPILDEVDTKVCQEREKGSLGDSPRGMDMICPFCLLALSSMNIEVSS